MTPFTLALAALATYRVARIIAVDLIGAPVRRAAQKLGDTAGYLAQCPWCLSIWLAPVPVACMVIWPGNRAVEGSVGALAVSALVGLVHTAVTAVEDRSDG